MLLNALHFSTRYAILQRNALHSGTCVCIPLIFLFPAFSPISPRFPPFSPQCSPAQVRPHFPQLSFHLPHISHNFPKFLQLSPITMILAVFQSILVSNFFHISPILAEICFPNSLPISPSFPSFIPKSFPISPISPPPRAGG